MLAFSFSWGVYACTHVEKDGLDLKRMSNYFLHCSVQLVAITGFRRYIRTGKEVPGVTPHNWMLAIFPAWFIIEDDEARNVSFIPFLKLWLLFNPIVPFFHLLSYQISPRNMSSITAAELNYIVHRYLTESGNSPWLYTCIYI